MKYIWLGFMFFCSLSFAMENKPTYTPLLVFVSFSMPDKSLEQWITQTQQAGGTVVIRGLINNSFKETAKKLKPILQQTQGGLIIDPMLFQKYSIQQVPAVVIQSEKTFDVLYGDVQLDYALEKLSQTKNAALAKQTLNTLRGKNT